MVPAGRIWLEPYLHILTIREKDWTKKRIFVLVCDMWAARWPVGYQKTSRPISRPIPGYQKTIRKPGFQKNRFSEKIVYMQILIFIMQNIIDIMQAKVYIKDREGNM